MASSSSSLTFQLSPLLFLSPLLHHHPSLLHFPQKPSNYPTKFTTFSASSANFLTTPQISPLFHKTHLPISSSESPINPFSSEDAIFLYDKCIELLRLSVRYDDVELAKAVHSLILKLDEDNYLFNSLINSYLKLGHLNHAYNVFNGISKPDVVSYSSMISGFAKNGYEFDAIDMFMKMREKVQTTKSMREDGSYEIIKKAIENLGLRHKERNSAYGKGNECRLTGDHETTTFLPCGSRFQNIRNFWITAHIQIS